jgi:HlyD family secretion protein
MRRINYIREADKLHPSEMENWAMKGKWLYTALGVLAVLAVVGVLVWRSRPVAQSEEAFRSAVVERGTMLVAVSASGSVGPEVRVSLAFELAGRVAEVPVEVGDRVEAGDVLARLDSERLAWQVRQAEAALASAEAQLAQLQVGPRPEEVAAAEANLEAAQAQVSAAAANRDHLVNGASDAQIAAADADLASAVAQQKIAEDTHNLTMECFTFSLAPGTVVPLPDGSTITLTEGLEDGICPALGVPEEQARYNLEAADKALVAARARYDEVLAGADANDVRAAQANVAATAAQRDALQAQLDLLLAGATDEQIAAAEARVAQAQTALEQAELLLGQATLRASFDGVVAEVNVTPGGMTSALPAITLVDTSGFHITIDVDEIDVGQISEGQEVEVTLDSFPDAVIAGIVERIAPAATRQGGVVYYDVTVKLEPTDVQIRADMTANATIVVDEITGVLLIPTWVVRVDRDTGTTYVDRQVGGEVERVDVVLGVRHGGSAQVLDGLSEGDVAVWVEDGLFDFGSQ